LVSLRSRPWATRFPKKAHRALSNRLPLGYDGPVVEPADQTTRPVLGCLATGCQTACYLPWLKVSVALRYTLSFLLYLMQDARMRTSLLLLAVLGISGACASSSESRRIASAPAPSAPSASAVRNAETLKTEAGQVLATFLQRQPAPPACTIGVQLGNRPIIVALSHRAEQAGLRRGDRLKSIAGVPLQTPEDLPRAFSRISPSMPVTFLVVRQGEELSVSVPCHQESAFWSAWRRALESASNANWETCQTSALEATRLRGFVAASQLQLRARCAAVQAGLRGAPRLELGLARMVYEWRQAEIREKSFEPGGLDDIRGSLLATIKVVRENGFSDYATALEDQGRNAPKLAEAEQGRRSSSAAEPSIQSSPQISQGTAFFVRPDGILVTALHIVDRATAIVVKCPNREPTTATLGDTARSLDLAVLRTPCPILSTFRFEMQDPSS